MQKNIYKPSNPLDSKSKISLDLAGITCTLCFLKQQYYEVPIAMKSVFDLIDTFQSRIKDMEKQKKEGITCKEDKKQSLENFLSRYTIFVFPGKASAILPGVRPEPKKHSASCVLLGGCLSVSEHSACWV